MAGTYRQILASSSIMASAQAVNYSVGLARVKAIAILLGPTGVGIIGLYATAVSLVGSITSLGLHSSAVRTIAGAASREDSEAVARTVNILRRLCWITGLLGWVAIAAISVPLSHLMFQSGAHAWAFATLGGTILLSAICNGQMALLQGLRRVGDIARVQVTAALLNVAITVLIYVLLRERGIVPALIANSIISLAATWWFARRIQFEAVPLSWKVGVAETWSLLGVGLALTWSGVLVLAVDLLTRALVARDLGVVASGHYQAAWALSGLFAGFVLTAMGMDFYPRLAAVAHDHKAATRAINEQTEIGVLLSLPGLLAMLALAKPIVILFYSAKFLPAAELLVWMVLGVFGRIVSWPMGYVQLALGAGRWFMVSETIFHAVQGVFVFYFVANYGLLGAAYSFAAFYVVHVAGMYCIARRLIGFSWTAECAKLVGVAATVIATTLCLERMLAPRPAMLLGCLIAVIFGIWSLRGLGMRLGESHPLSIWLHRARVLRRAGEA